MSTLKAIIFDHSTLTGVPTRYKDELLDLLGRIKTGGLKVVVNANDPIDLSAELGRHGLPQADLYLTGREVGERKGGKKWTYVACERLGVASHELLYVGDSERDWRTAINTAVMYLQATWSETSPLSKEALSVYTPMDVWFFASHFLMQPPRWEYTFDGTTSHLRSLLNASRDFPGERKSGESWLNGFNLKDVFTLELEVRIGTWSGRDALMTHALTSLYLEGLIPEGPFIAAYPSHTPGQLGGPVEDWVRPAAKLFHGWFKDDLFVRATEAPDTSRLRASGGRATPEMQMGTVHLNPAYRTKLAERTVILVDDFSTTGTSLELGRNLLVSAGARKVILLSVGKFGRNHPLTHTTYRPKAGVKLDPYVVLASSASKVFQVGANTLRRDEEAPGRVLRSLDLMQSGEPFI